MGFSLITVTTGTTTFTCILLGFWVDASCTPKWLAKPITERYYDGDPGGTFNHFVTKNIFYCFYLLDQALPSYFWLNNASFSVSTGVFLMMQTFASSIRISLTSLQIGCNTFINGRTYKNDDNNSLSWELEMNWRYDVSYQWGRQLGVKCASNSFGPCSRESLTIDVAGHMKTVDTKSHDRLWGHVGHTWQWASGDTVSNGSGYGVDYNILAHQQLTMWIFTSIQHRRQCAFGGKSAWQRLGYPNAVSGQAKKSTDSRIMSRFCKSQWKALLLSGELGWFKWEYCR